MATATAVLIGVLVCLAVISGSALLSRTSLLVAVVEPLALLGPVTGSAGIAVSTNLGSSSSPLTAAAAPPAPVDLFMRVWVTAKPADPQS